MSIVLEKRAREALAQTISRYLTEELDAEISGMQAQLLIDFLSERLGPHFYNQALLDARAHLSAKMEALADAFYELEKPAKV